MNAAPCRLDPSRTVSGKRKRQLLYQENRLIFTSLVFLLLLPFTSHICVSGWASTKDHDGHVDTTNITIFPIQSIVSRCTAMIEKCRENAPSNRWICILGNLWLWTMINGEKVCEYRLGYVWVGWEFYCNRRAPRNEKSITRMRQKNRIEPLNYRN